MRESSASYSATLAQTEPNIVTAPQTRVMKSTAKQPLFRLITVQKTGAIFSAPNDDTFWL